MTDHPPLIPSITSGITLGSDADTDELLKTVILRRYATDLPHSWNISVDRLRVDAPLVPTGVIPYATHGQTGFGAHLAQGTGWLLYANWGNNRATVLVVADEPALARTVAEAATEGASKPPSVNEGEVEMGFCYLTSHGSARRNWRSIAADAWTDIEHNYTPQVVAAFDRLVRLTPDGLNGRILLMHGPPGTGKTTVLRSLARSWRDWCKVDFILDPERLFSEPGYLMDVVIGPSDDDEKWRLLLLEDCDELIRSSAKEATGQGLARLLNLTDGILGQGRRVLVAITTNEDLGALHPAVTRPGRCLAQVEVDRFAVDDARRWLNRQIQTGHVPRVDEPKTLAELYALRDSTSPIAVAAVPEQVGGQYL